MGKLGEPFIKPIPTRCMCLVTALSGSATKTFLLLWYLSGVSKTKINIPISYTQAEKFHLPGKSLRRGLKELETAGIISTNRGIGKAPRVTILLKEKGLEGVGA